MKKILLFTLLTAGFVSAQTLQTEDFNSYTVGNVCTSTAGTTAGQGSYYAYNGAVTDYQIVSEGGVHDKVLQIAGPASTTPTALYLWKDGLSTLWGTRTTGNNIIEIEVDLYVGGASTSKNGHLIYLYDSTGSKVLAGLRFVPETGVLTGVAYYNNAGTLNNYSFNLLASGSLVLAANSWYRIGMSYDYTTGQVLWNAPGMTGAAGVIGAASTNVPTEIDFVASAGTSNASSSTMKWDNMTVKATSTNTLLPAQSFQAEMEVFTAFPNPTTGIINIDTPNNAEVKNMQLVDVNGRVIKTINGFVSQLDITSLSNGVYMLTIETATAKETKKIIKN